MSYTYETRVGFSQSGVNHKMTIPAIIDAYQDCSCFHSEDLNIGCGYLEPRNLVWVINYWEVEFYRMPVYPEKITVGTHPYQFKSFMGMRNFFLKDENGEFLSKANSLWVLMDWDKMTPVRPPEEVVEGYTLENKLDMNYGSRKIVVPKEDDNEASVDITQEEPITIQQLHLDANGHVNNGQYIKIAMAYIPGDIDYKGLRVEYRNQAHLGDCMHPVVYKTDESYIISLNNDEGTPYSIVELKM